MHDDHAASIHNTSFMCDSTELTERISAELAPLSYKFTGEHLSYRNWYPYIVYDGMRQR